MDLRRGKVEITSQNHGFAVDVDSLEGRAELTHVNLNDQTVEGLRGVGVPLFSVQYHPEASPGPHDAGYLFARFRRLVEAFPRYGAEALDRIAAEEPLREHSAHAIGRKTCRFAKISNRFCSSAPARSSSARPASSTTRAPRRCKALREEGLRLILVNSNPATIMTDPEFADRTYIEPMTVATLDADHRDANGPTRCCRRSAARPALNLAIELAEAGVLERYGVELIGAKLAAIKKAEDRDLFKAAMIKIGLEVPASGVAHSHERGRSDPRASSACR